MKYGETQEIKSANGEVLRGFRFTVSNPPKEAVLRLPTSDEMVARMDAQKSIRRGISRRASRTEAILNPKADLDLFNRLRIDKGEDFDDYEAGNALSKLTAVEVADFELLGNQATVTLRTPFCTTRHVVRVPTAKQMANYKDNISHAVELPHGQEELRCRTQAGIDLYDAVISSIEGYADNITPQDVPAHHKFAVAAELGQAEDLMCSISFAV